MVAISKSLGNLFRNGKKSQIEAHNSNYLSAMCSQKDFLNLHIAQLFKITLISLKKLFHSLALLTNFLILSYCRSLISSKR